MRNALHALACILLLVLAACAAPATQPVAGKAAAPPGPSQAAVVRVDATCKVDADCVVKDVGNCCGYFPACVNRASPTDPAGVRARCAKSGMASVCGFREISACGCVQGKCAATGGGALSLPAR